jgi:hypothetical protein
MEESAEGFYATRNGVRFQKRTSQALPLYLLFFFSWTNVSKGCRTTGIAHINSSMEMRIKHGAYAIINVRIGNYYYNTLQSDIHLLKARRTVAKTAGACLETQAYYSPIT